MSCTNVAHKHIKSFEQALCSCSIDKERQQFCGDKFVDIKIVIENIKKIIGDDIYRNLISAVQSKKDELETISTYVNGGDSRVLCALEPDDVYVLLASLASMGLLKVPFDSPLWSWRSSRCPLTPAHWAAREGYLQAEYTDKIWTITTATFGLSVAHVAACSPQFCPPPDSPLWKIKNRFGVTPAHISAQYGYLTVPYSCEEIWGLRDSNGKSPAHYAAERGYFKAVPSSKLWKLKDYQRNTPAHILALNGELDLPYTSECWLMKNSHQQTPAAYMKCTEMVLAHIFSEKEITRNYFSTIGDILDEPLTIEGLSILPKLYLCCEDNRGIYKNIIQNRLKRYLESFGGIQNLPQIFWKNLLNKRLLLRVAKNKDALRIYAGVIKSACGLSEQHAMETSIQKVVDFMKFNVTGKRLCSLTMAHVLEQAGILQELLDELLDGYDDKTKNCVWLKLLEILNDNN